MLLNILQLSVASESVARLHVCGLSGHYFFVFCDSYGHTKMGARFKVASERLVNPRIQPKTPGLQGQ